MNSPNERLSTHLDELRMALSQGTRHSLRPIVKAALGAGCTKAQLMLVADEVGSYTAKAAVRNALDQEAQSKPILAESEFGPGCRRFL